MEITNEQHDRLQEYLDGNMSEPEQEQFLAEINADEALKQHFEFEMQLREDMESIAEKKETYALYTQIEASAASDNIETTNERIALPAFDTGNDQEKQIKKSKLFVMRPWVMAAAACVVAGLIGLFYLLKPANNPDDDMQNKLASLYNSYFEKDTIPKANHPLLAKAFADYEKNEYATMEKYDLENLPDIKGVDNQRQLVLEYGYYYKGISYLQTKDFEKANKNFQWVIDSAGKQDLILKAKWYLALSLVKTGDTKKAIQLLEALSSGINENEYRNKANTLLNELKKTMAEPKQ